MIIFLVEAADSGLKDHCRCVLMLSTSTVNLKADLFSAWRPSAWKLNFLQALLPLTGTGMWPHSKGGMFFPLQLAAVSTPGSFFLHKTRELLGSGVFIQFMFYGSQHFHAWYVKIHVKSQFSWRNETLSAVFLYIVVMVNIILQLVGVCLISSIGLAIQSRILNIVSKAIICLCGLDQVLVSPSLWNDTIIVFFYSNELLFSSQLKKRLLKIRRKTRTCLTH